MLSRGSFVGIIFLFLYSVLPAQNPIPSTVLVEYEVLTAELKSNTAPQSLRLRINTTGVITPENIDIRLTGIPGKLTLLDAEKSGAALWLIQSSENAARENVLAWNYIDSTGTLRVYPFSYTAPYVLTLEIQLNLYEKTISAENQQNSVMVETLLPNGVFAATVTGRGNIITLNK
jgi:hypothetical protein